ncbi:MAG: hypothetical protein IPN29_17765 [Saprospiraceae bacterium]|nr:hypothetical protein [Saprospiraceae bacterium]
MANYNTTGKLNEGFAYLENELNEIYFDYLEFFVRPAQGVCYDNQVIKNGNRTVQVGRYKGSFPFEIEVLALYRDSFISARQTIVNAEKVLNYKAVAQSHAMCKILNLENGPQSDNAIAGIVETSLNHRVLSRYTAFLALEPGLQEPCLDCEDESDGSTVAVEDESESEIKLSAFPNPFVNELKVVISGVSSDSDIDSYAIYDATGRQRFVHIELQKDAEAITLTIEGTPLKRVYTC